MASLTEFEKQLLEQQRKLLRERDQALEQAEQWKSIALGLLIIIAYIILTHYYPQFIPYPSEDPPAEQASFFKFALTFV